MKSDPESEFEKANRLKQAGIVKEFVAFLGENRKFWLIPLLLTLLLVGALLILGGTAAAPFIYTLF